MLSSLDTILTPSDTVSIGPFAIFSKVEHYECHDNELLRPNARQDCGSEVEPSQSGSPDISGRLPEITPAESVTPDAKIYEIDLFSDWVPLSSMVDTPNSTKSPYSIRKLLAINQSPHAELSVPLFEDSHTSMLIYHYKDCVADLLQPVFHPRNPWRTTYLPFAIEGCPDICLMQNAVPSSGVSISLFHSILSSAAFHLRNVTGGSREYHNLGLQHRAKSLQALKFALVAPKDSQQYTIFLTAMLSLVTIDVGDFRFTSLNIIESNK